MTKKRMNLFDRGRNGSVFRSSVELWNRCDKLPDDMDIRRYTALQQEMQFPIKKNM